jgi:hypothetical protein
MLMGGLSNMVFVVEGGNDDWMNVMVAFTQALCIGTMPVAINLVALGGLLGDDLCCSMGCTAVD